MTSEEARAMAVKWQAEYAEVSTKDRASLYNAASLLIREVMRVTPLLLGENGAAQAPAGQPAPTGDGLEGSGCAGKPGCVVC